MVEAEGAGAALEVQPAGDDGAWWTPADGSGDSAVPANAGQVEQTTASSAALIALKQQLAALEAKQQQLEVAAAAHVAQAQQTQPQAATTAAQEQYAPAQAAHQQVQPTITQVRSLRNGLP